MSDTESIPQEAKALIDLYFDEYSRMYIWTFTGTDSVVIQFGWPIEFEGQDGDYIGDFDIDPKHRIEIDTDDPDELEARIDAYIDKRKGGA